MKLSKLLLLTASISLCFVTYGMQRLSTSATRALQRSHNALRVPQQNIPQFSRWQRFINQWNQLRNWYSAKIHKPKLQPMPLPANLTNRIQPTQKPSFTPKSFPTTQQKPSVTITPRAEKYLDNLISTAKPTRGPTHPFFESTPLGRASRSEQVSPYRMSTRAYSQKARDLGYTLDMPNFNAKELAKKLIEHNLTVADVVYAQCAQEEQAAYQKIKETALLDDNDLNKLNSIMTALKQDVLQGGNYKKENITFKQKVDAQTQQLMHEVFQKTNIPFKVIVGKFEADEREDWVGAAVWHQHPIRSKQIEIFDKISTGVSGTYSMLELFLSVTPQFFRLSIAHQKFMIAHEATHLLNMHVIEEFIVEEYFEKVKKLRRTRHPSDIFTKIFMLNGKNITESLNDLNTAMRNIHEIQADLLPLAFYEYALGAIEINQDSPRPKTQPPPNIYIPTSRLLLLASRAIELHEAMNKLLEIKK